MQEQEKDYTPDMKKGPGFQVPLHRGSSAAVTVNIECLGRRNASISVPFNKTI